MTLARQLERRGFTLLELLVVLAILVVVASIASFPIKSFLEQQTLQQEAEKIRVRWGRTRIEAMRSGRIYVFQFKPGEMLFRTQVFLAADDQLESNNPVLVGGELVAPTVDSAPAMTSSVEGEGELAEGLVFAGVETLDDRAAVLTAEDQERAQEEWSPPILFYPDGTTSTARLIISDAKQRGVQLDLRGLTGISRISAVDLTAEVVR